MYVTLRADGNYHYLVADYNNCMVMEMDPGQKEVRWHAWPGGEGKEGPAVLFLLSPLAAARGEAWLQGLLLRLARALAGPAGDPTNALLRRRLGCNVAGCA